MEPSPLPKADKETVDWWRSRLNRHRSLVVFTWNALTFHKRFYLPGGTVWLGIQLTVLVLFQTNYSVLQIAGQVLVISAILYILPYIASKFLHTDIFPQWNPEYEDRFQHICVHLAHAQEKTSQKVEMAFKARRETPWKFYGVCLGVALLSTQLGKWFSTALVVHFLTCCILMLPVVMEFNIASTKNQEAVKALVLEIYRRLKLKFIELAEHKKR